MTDDDIREKIAEMKGYELNSATREYPNWPVSIADAEELWDEMPDGTRVWRTRKHWVCAKINGFYREAETKSRAISEAWLAWKESQ